MYLNNFRFDTDNALWLAIYLICKHYMLYLIYNTIFHKCESIQCVHIYINMYAKSQFEQKYTEFCHFEMSSSIRLQKKENEGRFKHLTCYRIGVWMVCVMVSLFKFDYHN